MQQLKALDTKKFLYLLPFLFLPSSFSIAQTDPGARVAAREEAIFTGKIKEYLSTIEAKALEAERKQRWDLASGFYQDATQAALASGQLQKAISYGTKAFDTAEKAGGMGKDEVARLKAEAQKLIDTGNDALAAHLDKKEVEISQ